MRFAVLSILASLAPLTLSLAIPDDAGPLFKVDAHLLVTNTEPFRAMTDRLQQTLPTGYTTNVTDAINAYTPQLFSQPLINANKAEARVYIISPTEFKALQAVGVTMKEVVDIAYNNYIAYTIFTLGCIGKYVDPSGAEVAYIQTKARTWDNMRRDIDNLFKKKGGKKGYAAQPFYPHIVIGETQPGVVKDDNYVGNGVCVADTKNEDPIGIGLQVIPNPIPVDF
jgi:hypothetical protein